MKSRLQVPHESNIVVRQAKPSEKLLEELINQFEVKPEFTNKSVIRSIKITKFDRCVNSSEERTVEPSSTLRYQLRDAVGRVGDTIS